MTSLCLSYPICKFEYLTQVKEILEEFCILPGTQDIYLINKSFVTFFF